MFTDQTFEPVGFDSQISSEKSENTAIVQTETILSETKASQNTELRTSSTQTVEVTPPNVEVNYANLASFLKRITPGVMEMLDEVHGSNAFEGYHPSSSDEPTARVQILSSFYTLGDTNTNKKLSDVSWSTGGGYLVVSCSVVHHETWCDHLSEIKFYKISGEDKIQETPNKTLEVQSCVTNLAYHPTEPSILAAGLFNGDVLLWNLRDEEFVTPMQICTHGDSVTSLLWLPKILSDSVIATTSADGYIYINGITREFSNVVLHKRFKISKEHNPAESSRPRSSGGKRERAVEAGLSLTGLDFSLISPGIFIVGTLCGGIYKCSLENPIPIDSGDVDDSDNPLSDPVVGEYERHEGSVTCIKCSPTRNIFLSCGTDKEIRLYDIDQTIRLQTINVENTVVRFAWYPKSAREIIGAYGASSSVDFYDATNGKAITKLKMESTRQNTSCLDFNVKRDLVAIGDTKGKLEIWKISGQAMS